MNSHAFCTREKKIKNYRDSVDACERTTNMDVESTMFFTLPCKPTEITGEDGVLIWLLIFDILLINPECYDSFAETFMETS